MNFELRDYQKEALGLVRTSWREGSRYIALVMPTGSGKTSTAVMFARSALERGKRVLWIVHRRELAEQAYQRMLDAGIPEVGIIMAGDDREHPTAPTQVCSVQTLFARGDRPAADVMIWDECHHVVATTFREVAGAYPNATHLGLTATPERADGTALGNVFRAIVAPVSISSLVQRGFLVRCDVVGPAKFLESGLAWDPVEALQKFAPDRQAVMFCANVADARARAAQAASAGIRAAFVDGTTDLRARKSTLDQFAAGELQLVTNVYVLTEGWDCPSTSVCILARGCGSAATYLQMVGRVLRPAPGKDRALLIDLRGVVHLHGLPDEDRAYSLEGAPIRQAAASAGLRTCAECGAVFKTQSVCPRCGFEFPAPKAPEVTKRNLDRVQTVVSRTEKLNDWLAFCRECAQRGYQPGWAAHKFKARYGHWPEKSFPKFHEVAA